MEIFIKQLFMSLSTNVVAELFVLWVIADTFFGCLRSLKEGSFNSSFGIDGGIRKVGMIASVIFLAFADMIIHFNLIGFIPKEALTYINIDKIGTLEFFGILFIIYETISILKNMYLLGIPMPIWLKEKLEKLLTQLTDEVPSKLEIETKE